MATEGGYPESCPCLDKVVVADGDHTSKVKAPKARKALRRKAGTPGGEGKHCVFSRKSGKLVRCYKSEDAARRVAKGFGPKFRMGLRSSTPKKSEA